MTEEVKNCPYCGKEILSVAKKCKYCGQWLSGDGKPQTVSINIQNVIKYLKLGTTIFMGIVIAVLLIWILFFDYTAAARNHENFWYGQYLTAGILHTLLLIWATLVIHILRK